MTDGHGSRMALRQTSRRQLSRRQGWVGLSLILAFAGGILGWSSLDAAYASSTKTIAAGPVTVLPAANSATSDRGDYILEIVPSASDRALWSLARQSLARFDSAALSSLSSGDISGADAAQLQKLSEAYDSLLASVDAQQNTPTHFLLTSISASLLDNFKDGNLPQSALFSAATRVEAIDADKATSLALPTWSVTRSTADSAVVLEQVQQVQDAFAGLNSLDQDFATGTLSQDTFHSLDDQQLHDLVASSPFAAQAQTELDRRLSENLPDLSSYSNGLLPENLLCQIPWATQEKLLCATMDNFIRLNEAYKAEFGTDLPILDGYRPLSEQQYVHYNDPNWTAVPGTSNHGWGLAVDFDWDVFSDWNDPQVVWLINNGPRFGWRHPTALGPSSDRPEPWHYEFGTTYSDRDSADFQGPTPDVIYRFTFPAAQR